ncbi:hypothetical protein ACXWQN_09275, partial [Streptococcus pyogenes]
LEWVKISIEVNNIFHAKVSTIKDRNGVDLTEAEDTKNRWQEYTEAFDCVDHNKLWKILKEMGIPDHLTCLLRNLYAGQEVTVRLDMEQRSSSNQERSMSRLYFVTLLV